MGLLSGRRKTSAALIFTTLQGSGDYYCTRRNALQVTQMLKTFSSACLCHRHSLLDSALNLSLDNTVPVHEWWTVFMVCSMCAHRQQCLLFCLFVADRAWVLFAVRPGIQSYSLTYWWGSTKLQAQTRETAAKKTTLVKFPTSSSYFNIVCVCV